MNLFIPGRENVNYSHPHHCAPHVQYDHVGVGTGTVVNRPAIKQYQKAMRDRCASKIEGGKIIKVRTRAPAEPLPAPSAHILTPTRMRSPFSFLSFCQVEAHPIPEHMRARRVVDRAALVGDAAGYVTKCSGEGIYFAAKSGRMAGEAVSKVVKVRVMGESAWTLSSASRVVDVWCVCAGHGAPALAAADDAGVHQAVRLALRPHLHRPGYPPARLLHLQRRP